MIGLGYKMTKLWNEAPLVCSTCKMDQVYLVERGQSSNDVLIVAPNSLDPSGSFGSPYICRTWPHPNYNHQNL